MGLCCSLESGQERRPGVDRVKLHKDPIVVCFIYLSKKNKFRIQLLTWWGGGAPLQSFRGSAN